MIFDCRADLEKTSRLNVLLNLCLVALVVFNSPVIKSVEEQGGIMHLISQERIFDVRTFFIGFGVCSFAFVCQDSSFIIAGSMKNPTKNRWKQVTHAAMITCCLLELVMGICGFLSYAENTLGNVLNNMKVHHWSGVASRSILATTMFFAYPLNAYIARHVCVVLLFEGVSAHEGDDSLVLRRRDRRIILTWVLYIVSLIPALAVENTGKVLAATGAIGGSSLAYIGPGSTFLALHSHEFIVLLRQRWGTASRLLWCYPVMEAEKNRIINNEEQLINDSCRISEEGRHQKHVGLSLETNEGGLGAPTPKAMSTFILDVIAWYILGMPLWSAIAQKGKMKLSEHFKKEETISPRVARPKRVTVVKHAHQLPILTHSGADCLTCDTEMKEEKGIFRSPSDSAITHSMETSSGARSNERTALLQPKSIVAPGGLLTVGTAQPFSLSTAYGSTQVVAGNRGIAKAIASQNNQNTCLLERTNSLSSLDVEIELRNEDPTWTDFRIAIGYIFLGVVAMTFGLVSIVM